MEYDRFDSPHIQAERNPATMEFNWESKSLYLDFHNLIREENNFHERKKYTKSSRKKLQEQIIFFLKDCISAVYNEV